MDKPEISLVDFVFENQDIPIDEIARIYQTSPEEVMEAISYLLEQANCEE